MSKEPLPMNEIISILRLHHTQNQSIRKIAKSLGLKRSTVNDYLQRASAANISWPLPSDWNEQQLYNALFARETLSPRRPLPDWAYIHTELSKKGVTLQLLHDEYMQDHPDGYRYSQFCTLYRRFRKNLNISMRQVYRVGEKLFVDYAGQTILITNHSTSKSRKAYLFVAVLGASNYTYAEATYSQGLEEWITAHIHAFEYFGGVTELTIPDNLKSAVVKPCRYEPVLNPAYLEFAKHYHTCIIPTRVARPKDKAKVEAGVLVAERWILAALRKRVFFSLAELNFAISGLLDTLNKRPFKKLPGCRYSQFVEFEKPALQPLPQKRFEYAQWRTAKVNIDYHVAFHIRDRRYHYYSVPHTLVNQKVDIRFTHKTLEIYFNHKRVAAHQRDDTPGKHTTLSEHMPKSHKRYLEWTPSRILSWAGKTGAACAQIAQIIMDNRPHPEQGFRSCLGIIRLGRQYGNNRLEAACRRALTLKIASYKSIKNILENNLDKRPLEEDNTTSLPLNSNTHIRGSNYYK